MHWGGGGKIENYLEESCTRMQVLMGIKRYYYSISRCTVTEIKELASHAGSLVKAI